MNRITGTPSPKALLPLPAALLLALAACDNPDEPTYEAGAEDLSGSELIVTEEDPDAVPVDVPDIEMTPVPPGASSPSPEATATAPAE